MRKLNLPDGWIGAGFVRNAVWDHLHARPPSPPAGDVDVVWYDPSRLDPAWDKAQETALRLAEPSIDWSVRNQARMHVHNGDAPYASTTDALRYWPETATAVAVRRSPSDGCDVAAPWGTDDLLGLILRPTTSFADRKRDIFEDRIRAKGWMERWPRLRRREPDS